MRRVARLRPLGLRGRIIGVVLVTAAAALAVATIPLLSRLESSLKKAEGTALTQELKSVDLKPFTAVLPSGLLELPRPARRRLRQLETYYALLHPSLPETPAMVNEAGRLRSTLDRQANSLVSQIGASDVVLLGTQSHHATGLTPIVIEPAPAPLAKEDRYSDAVKALLSGKPQHSLATIGGTDYARAAIPLHSHHLVLVVRKRISEVSTAVSAVRTALLDATLVAAALTLLLAIPFASTVVRRLRRLRQTALRVAHEGPNVEIPSDRARDEVGDLARTFALMQQQLRRQEEARRAFVATASHELRTPVASLDGLLELMDEDLRSDNPDLEDARALLERSRAQSRRLGRLAADLLDLSRIDAEITLRSEPVELGELSRAVLAEFEVATKVRGVITSLDDHHGSVWALGDPGSVARILRILVDNAVGVSPDGGRITVRLHNGDGARAQLSVCDQGPGVHPEERDVIFERFMRGRDAGGRGGFGLGLAIGRELARRMGGELVLEDHDGSGARFTLALPAAEAPQEEPVAVL